MAVSTPLGAVLHQDKPDPSVQVQKGEAEGMTMHEGAVRLSVYQIIPLFSAFSKSWAHCSENVAGSTASV